MTPADLMPLALAAIDDAEARLVLADAIEESGWWDDRAWAVLPLLPWGSDGQRRWLALPSSPIALAAVLLFGGWSTEMWPAARRCLEPIDERVLRAVQRVFAREATELMLARSRAAMATNPRLVLMPRRTPRPVSAWDPHGLTTKRRYR